jgi:hypothetical protein
LPTPVQLIAVAIPQQVVPLDVTRHHLAALLSADDLAINALAEADCHEIRRALQPLA